MSDKIKITEEERAALVTGDTPDFPKYTTQILNIAINNSQAQRPHTVGSMNDLIEEFNEKNPDGEYEDWVEFYMEKHNGEERLEGATEKTTKMVENLKQAMEKIDEEMVRDYVKDLVLYKTYRGFDIQESVLRKVSEKFGLDYELGDADDESKGIDGYLEGEPVSVKPVTYKQKDELSEEIDAPIIYYEEYSSSEAIKIDISELKRNDMI
jgi:hypothetical protein